MRSLCALTIATQVLCIELAGPLAAFEASVEGPEPHRLEVAAGAAGNGAHCIPTAAHVVYEERSSDAQLSLRKSRDGRYLILACKGQVSRRNVHACLRGMSVQRCSPVCVARWLEIDKNKTLFRV